jgi:hypothetical protein
LVAFDEENAVGPKDTPPRSTTAGKTPEIQERIEKNELLARDLESQARIFEARIRLAEAKSKFRKRAGASADEKE